MLLSVSGESKPNSWHPSKKFEALTIPTNFLFKPDSREDDLEHDSPFCHNAAA